MERIFSVNIKGNKLCASDNWAFVFKKGNRLIQKINLKTYEVTAFNLPRPVEKIEIQEDKFILFFQKSIEFFCITTLKRTLSIVMPNIELFFEFPNEQKLFICRKLKILYSKSTIPVSEAFINYQVTKDFLFIEYHNKVELYQNKLGLVYAKSINDLNNEIGLDIRPFSFISIRNKKIYFLSENRIIGPDLNIYLNDLSSSSFPVVKEYNTKNSKFIKFENIQNGLILLDNQKNLIQVQKNLTKILFKTKADQFLYNDSNSMLLVIHKSQLTVYRPLSQKIQPFKLIEENIIYSEAEDEFDESNDTIQMFNKIILNKTEN